MRSQRQHIQDLLEAMEYAEDFVEDVSFEELEDDVEKQFALQRAFEVIGEATKQLDLPLRGPPQGGHRTGRLKPDPHQKR